MHPRRAGAAAPAARNGRKAAAPRRTGGRAGRWPAHPADGL